jgi:hypothetical protein
MPPLTATANAASAVNAEEEDEFARATIASKAKPIAARWGQRCHMHISQGCRPKTYWETNAPPNNKAGATMAIKRAFESGVTRFQPE